VTDRVRSRLSVDSRIWPYAIVTAAILIANASYLIGYTHLDPKILRAHLGISAQPGPLAGWYTIDPNEGVTTQALGVQALHQWFSGHVPWWNPFEGIGTPLAGGLESASFFPILVLQALPAGFFVYHLALELIAGLSTVALVRTLGMGRAAATAAGTMFGLTGSLVWLMNGPSVPVAFIPLILLGIERAYRQETGGYVLLGLAIWGSITAGFPEVTYLAGLFALAYAVWRFVCSRRDTRLRFVRRLAIGGGLGALLSAPALVAFLDYLHAGAYVGGHTGTFARLGLSHQALGIQFTPYAYGPLISYIGFSPTVGQKNVLYSVWANVGGYLTAAALVLGLIGVTSRRFLGLRIICFGWTIASLAKMYAVPVVTPAVKLIPGMKQLAFYRYAPPTVTIAVVLLVAIGVDDIRRGAVGRVRAGGALVVSAAVLFLCRRLATPLVSAIEDKGGTGIGRWYHYAYLEAAVVVLVIAAAVAIGPRAKQAAAWIAVGLACAEAVVFFAIPSFSAARSYRPDSQLVAFLKDQARKSDDGTDLGRIYSLNARPDPNYGSYYDVATLGSAGLPQPTVWQKYINRALAPGVIPNRLGVSALASSQIPLFEQHLAGYQNAGVEYVIADPSYHVPAKLSNVLIPYRTTATAVIYRLRGAKPYAGDVAGSCTVTARSRTSFTATCAQPSTFVRREAYFDGWSATVNGKQTTIQPYDGAFESVQLPAGTSTVRFSYVPRGGNIALLAELAALLAIVALLGLRAAGRPIDMTALLRKWRRSPAAPAHSRGDPDGRESDRRESDGVREQETAADPPVR
jgi:Bacterial membrane protein YfhO